MLTIWGAAGGIPAETEGPLATWREWAASFEALSYCSSGETSVTVNGASDYATTTRVTAGYFRVLGATARIGRLLSAEEEQPGGPLSAVITGTNQVTMTTRSDVGPQAAVQPAAPSTPIPQ